MDLDLDDLDGLSHHLDDDGLDDLDKAAEVAVTPDNDAAPEPDKGVEETEVKESKEDKKKRKAAKKAFVAYLQEDTTMIFSEVENLQLNGKAVDALLKLHGGLENVLTYCKELDKMGRKASDLENLGALIDELTANNKTETTNNVTPSVASLDFPAAEMSETPTTTEEDVKDNVGSGENKAEKKLRKAARKKFIEYLDEEHTLIFSESEQLRLTGKDVDALLLKHGGIDEVIMHCIEMDTAGIRCIDLDDLGMKMDEFLLTKVTETPRKGRYDIFTNAAMTTAVDQEDDVPDIGVDAGTADDGSDDVKGKQEEEAPAAVQEQEQEAKEDQTNSDGQTDVLLGLDQPGLDAHVDDLDDLLGDLSNDDDNDTLTKKVDMNAEAIDAAESEAPLDLAQVAVDDNVPAANADVIVEDSNKENESKEDKKKRKAARKALVAYFNEDTTRIFSEVESVSLTGKAVDALLKNHGGLDNVLLHCKELDKSNGKAADLEELGVLIDKLTTIAASRVSAEELHHEDNVDGESPSETAGIEEEKKKKEEGDKPSLKLLVAGEDEMPEILTQETINETVSSGQTQPDDKAMEDDASLTENTVPAESTSVSSSPSSPELPLSPRAKVESAKRREERQKKAQERELKKAQRLAEREAKLRENAEKDVEVFGEVIGLTADQEANKASKRAIEKAKQRSQVTSADDDDYGSDFDDEPVVMTAEEKQQDRVKRSEEMQRNKEERERKAKEKAQFEKEEAEKAEKVYREQQLSLEQAALTKKQKDEAYEAKMANILTARRKKAKKKAVNGMTKRKLARQQRASLRADQLGKTWPVKKKQMKGDLPEISPRKKPSKPKFVQPKWNTCYLPNITSPRTARNPISVGNLPRAGRPSRVTLTTRR